MSNLSVIAIGSHLGLALLVAAILIGLSVRIGALPRKR